MLLLNCKKQVNWRSWQNGSSIIVIIKKHGAGYFLYLTLSISPFEMSMQDLMFCLNTLARNVEEKFFIIILLAYA